MLSFLNKYAGNVHSQNGEDGILREALRRLGVTKSHAVEVGGHDGLWLSNIRYLLEQGWSGLYLEAGYNLYLKSKANWASNSRVRSQCCAVDGNNINVFVDDYCGVLSLDTDGRDYEIFKGLQARPKIVIVEIDSSYPPDVDAFNPDGAGTYRNTVELGLGKGYFLLCHTGNLIFVANQHRRLFPEIEGDGLSNAESYFNTLWLHPV